jgi:hypothetical protein
MSTKKNSIAKWSAQFLVTLAVGLVLAASASATVVIVKTQPTIYSTTALTGYTTTGAMMAGMTISVTYSDATVLSALWATTGGASGGASVANGFSLSESGDTYTSVWTLQNTRPTYSIVGFSINARTGDTVLDTTDPNTGTDGSHQGRDFEFYNGSQNTYSATATYSDALKLNSSATPVGDEYLRLTVSLSPSTYLASGGSLYFRQDTDNVSIPGDIVVVPEAGTGLFGVCLLAFPVASMLRRRR